MLETSVLSDERLRAVLQVMAREGMHRAVKGFSEMIGRSLTVARSEVTQVPFAEVPNLFGSPENEAVGIYLRARGDVAGQLMLVLAYPKALELVDLLMNDPPGTNQTLGELERSALGELGNLTGTFFINAVAEFTGFGVRPSPPAVLVDMIGAILDIVVATLGSVNPHVLMLKATFTSEGREVEADFWVIPDLLTLESLSKREGPHGR